MSPFQRQRGSAIPLPYEFDGRELDAFQQEAITHLLQSMSTMVSAPTGTGKTLVADFLVDRALGRGERVVYTGPIKALVGQKFRDFAQRFGKQRVGIVTGDVTHQDDAPVVVMTTEILRNMLLRRPRDLAGLRWAVFDEIHYLGHQDRGSVWEESILLLPRGVNILGLSATIPNAEQIVRWMEEVRGEPVGLVESRRRAVPLTHRYFNRACRSVTRPVLLQTFADLVAPDKDELDLKAGSVDDAPWWDAVRGLDVRDETSHLDVVHFIGSQRLYPCLYFDFSRKGAMQKAEQLAGRRPALSQKERERVRVTVKRTLEAMGLSREQVPDLERAEFLWQHGVGVHHAGLLPVVRRVTEKLLEYRVLRVVYATETFAVGVNLPVRSVCFDSLKKFDGRSYRYLSQHEYFQMAGRAGRRGLDKEGLALSVVPFNLLTEGPPPVWAEEKLEPIESRIEVTYNMTANLIARYSAGEIEALFASTLASFQSADTGDAAEALYAEFEEKAGVLSRLGHVEDGALTPKGEVLADLFVNEILVAELIDMGVLDEYGPTDLAGLVAALVAEPATGSGSAKRGRRGEARWTGGRRRGGAALKPPRWTTDLTFAGERLRRLGNIAPALHDALTTSSEVVARWCEGMGIKEVSRRCGVDPGDVVSLCRQSLDLLRQIHRAVPGHEGLKQRLGETMGRIDRAAVKVRVG